MSAVKTDEVFAEAKTVATVRISGENMPLNLRKKHLRIQSRLRMLQRLKRW